MPADLELALRVRADMREALRGIGALNRSLGDTALRGDEAGAALTGATGAAQAFTTALGALGRESGSTLGQARDAAESVFGAMESALARFVTTGRVSFSGFVDSVIADLARLATRRYYHPAARRSAVRRTRRRGDPRLGRVRPLASRRWSRRRRRGPARRREARGAAGRLRLRTPLP